MKKSKFIRLFLITFKVKRLKQIDKIALIVIKNGKILSTRLPLVLVCDEYLLRLLLKLWRLQGVLSRLIESEKSEPVVFNFTFEKSGEEYSTMIDIPATCGSGTYSPS